MKHLDFSEIGAGSGNPLDGCQRISTVCTPNCTSRCRLIGHVKDGKLLAVSPGEFPGRPDYGNLCLRGLSWPQRVYGKDRVLHPLKRIGARGEGKFEPISWDEAFDLLAQKIRQAQETHGPRSVAFFQMTGNLAKLAWDSPIRFANCVGGTTFSAEGIMSDHGASMGFQLVYGSQRASHDHRDYKNSKLLILWGRNPADTHTNEMRYILDAKQQGTKLVVIDPRLSSTAALADLWLPIRPGTDTALALGMMNLIISQNLHQPQWLIENSCAPFLVRLDNGQYLRRDEDCLVWDSQSGQAIPATQAAQCSPALSGQWTVDGIPCRTAFDCLLDEVREYSLEKTAQITGLDPQVIQQLAVEYATSRPSAIRGGQGMQRIYNSHQPFRVIATLAAICGYVGVSGGGASHVGGTNTVSNKPLPGVTGGLLNTQNWADYGGQKALEQKGSHLYEMIRSGQPYPIDLLWIAHSNFLNQSPDANQVIQEIFPKIPFIVCADPFLTWTAQYADLVLPVKTFWERWDFVNKAPWILLQQPVIDPVGESLSDCEIFTGLAKRLGISHLWDKTDKDWVREILSSQQLVAEGLDWDTLTQTGIFTRPGADFSPLYSFKDLKFKTPSGKLEFYSEKLLPFGQQVPTYTPPLEDPNGAMGKQYPLVFLQYHDRLFVNSQHVHAPYLEHIASEPCVDMNPADGAARGIGEGDYVRLYNDRGHCVVKAHLTQGIRPGVCAMVQGWTPDYFREGHYQTLTQLTPCPAEEAISETNFGAYDCLVEIEKVEESK